MKSNKLIALFGVLLFAMLWQIAGDIHDLTVHVNDMEQRLTIMEGLVEIPNTVEHSDKDVECLTKNIYYEAGTEKDLGKYAVAQVTINRVKTGQWGNTVCKVVHYPAQFSWTLKKDLPQPDSRLYAKCKEIAKSALNGVGVRGLDRTLFYHADYITLPKWVDMRYRVGQIGSHIFYERAKDSWLSL